MTPVAEEATAAIPAATTPPAPMMLAVCSELRPLEGGAGAISSTLKDKDPQKI